MSVVEEQNQDVLTVNPAPERNLFALGFVFGVVAGVVAAGLLAPRSGVQMRELIRERGLELRDRAEDAVMRAQQVANETLAQVKKDTHEKLGPDPSSPEPA
ncbi:MAG: YtxH domain-containing protein [Chloroflexales bacterium]|nr:YtxH domain-containing protein [Chloroflexales bacterium]